MRSGAENERAHGAGGANLRCDRPPQVAEATADDG